MPDFSKDFLLRALITKICETQQVPELKYEGEFYGEHEKLVKKLQERKADLPSLTMLKKTFKFEPEETDLTVTDILEKLNETYFIEASMAGLQDFKAIAQKMLKGEMPGKPDKALADLQKKFNNIRGVLTENFVCDIANDTDKVMIELEKEKARGGIIETGFEVIDKVVGAKAGDVLLLVMPTKRGKTQSMLRMQKHAIDHEIPSIYFSLEMSLIEMTNRIIASYGKYKFNDLKFFRVKPEEYKAELERVKKTPTHIVTRANESRIDLATIEKYIQEHKPRVVFIDYLMLIDGCDFNWSADVRPMAELKKIAQQNRCLIVVSQQADTQTMSGDDIPELTNVRGDKSISYDCNIFVGGTSTRMVNDENDPEDMVKLKFKYAVRASRDGKCPHFAYRVIPETGEWTDISEEIDL